MPEERGAERMVGEWKSPCEFYNFWDSSLQKPLLGVFILCMTKSFACQNCGFPRYSVRSLTSREPTRSNLICLLDRTRPS